MTRPSPDRETVKRRLDRYLWDDRSMPIVKLRKLLREHFWHFDDVAIIGGLVRDIARAGPSGFRSDVDLVIDAPRAAVIELATALGAVPNRFGGYAHHHPHWKIDFWALETTWVVANGYAVASSLKDVAACTFFDSDSILYGVKSRKVFADASYFERLQGRRLDIQLAATPSIQGNLLRAVRRLLGWNAYPGGELSCFLDHHLREANLESIRKMEASLYAVRYLDRYQDVDVLKKALFTSTQRGLLDTSFGEQMRLPGL